MEEEARLILKGALARETPHSLNLVQSIRRYVEPLGGVELSLPPRQPSMALLLQRATSLTSNTAESR